MDFSQRLLFWYTRNGRMLPWRETTEPYKVWLSEIILQQTRVDQGLDYYVRFVEAFPDVFKLASASEAQVLRLWQGLGYYSRARNMHATAREIALRRKGVFPNTYHEWVRLKGVGPYTAAAISSIAFNEPVPALDGNVLRILARLFAVEERIDSPSGKRVFHDIATSLIDEQKPGIFNQAMMDFGSMVCKPVRPDCDQCIFRMECLAYIRGEVTRFPLRSRKSKPRDRYFNYLFFFERKPDDTLMFFVRQREEKDIWRHLYDWPMVETSRPVSEIAEMMAFVKSGGCLPFSSAFILTGSPIRLKHQLTHQTIHASVYMLHVSQANSSLHDCYRMVDAQSFESLAKPRLIENAFHLINGVLSA